jgi:hypothetical protein
MDIDNDYSDGASQRQPSAEHTPQGTSAQVGGASSQGDPTPTSVQSSTTPSTVSGPPTNATHSQNSKRRRGLGVVTPNACTECRKKRAKVRSRFTRILLLHDGSNCVASLFIVHFPCISWRGPTARHIRQSNGLSRLFDVSSLFSILYSFDSLPC